MAREGKADTHTHPLTNPPLLTCQLTMAWLGGVLMEQGIHVVTANKKGLCSSMGLYNAILRQRRVKQNNYMYEVRTRRSAPDRPIPACSLAFVRLSNE